MKVIDEIRAKFPAMAERAPKSRKAAIRLFCLGCLGGSAAEVKRCSDITCSLYPWRLGTRDGETDDGEIERVDEPEGVGETDDGEPETEETEE